MRLRSPGPLALVAAALLLSVPARAAEPTRLALPGGLEVLVYPIPGASRVALRYLVRAGSALDPPGKEGLAHLLEHMVIRSSAGEVSLTLAADVAGARLNAFTSRSWTVFELDAPAATFGPLASRYLRAITSPNLAAGALTAELGVVQGEQGERASGRTIMSLVEDALFRVHGPEGTILGDRSSRYQIRLSDVVAAYGKAFATSGTTLVLAGAVTPEQARSLVEADMLLPPALPGEAPPSDAQSPLLPSTEKLWAPFLASTLGYRVEPGDEAACDALAELIELRLMMRLQLREPVVESVQAGCWSLHGTPFLVAFAASPVLLAGDLPDQMERTFREVAARPPTPAERATLEQRRARRADLVAQDPEALSDRVVEALVRGGRGASPPPVAAPRVLPLEAMQALARRVLVPERKLLVALSPFQD
jgi:predicted Zn-dependent peptidase